MAARPLILIAEHEFLIRSHAAEIINEAGYEVIEATNADEAMAILQSRRDVRVVFTDIQMPGTIKGLKLAHAIRERWPSIHILATGSAVREGDLPVDSIFFPKPYSPEIVAATLRALTGAQ